MKTYVLHTPRTVHRPIGFPAADTFPSIPKGVSLPVLAECATPFTFPWPGHATLVFQQEPDVADRTSANTIHRMKSTTVTGLAAQAPSFKAGVSRQTGHPNTMREWLLYFVENRYRAFRLAFAS